MSVIVNASTSTGLGITSDNSGTVEIQSNSTTKLTVASTGVYGTITHATAQATTSGTAIDFTGIPSWVKKITVIFNEVSLSGSDNILIRIGTAGTPDTTGYIATTTYVSHVNSTTGASSTAGFILYVSGPANIISGHIILTNMGSNTWVQSHSAKHATGSTIFGGGSKAALSGALDIVRITTAGSNTFDAGSINIMYEG
jgi:hypothetical protein